MKSAMTTVLVLSGVTSEEEIGDFAYRPDSIFDGIGSILE